jgi:hypothetical protein
MCVDLSLNTDNTAVAAAWTAAVNPYLNTLSANQSSAVTWQQGLSTIIGVYGYIKQYDIMKDYLKLAKEQVAQAERMTVLAEKNFNDISLPAYQAQRSLFDRYLTNFSGYETTYVEDAFRLKEYDPDYVTQQGRAVGTVQAMFDRAALQKRRTLGKYNQGRACHDATSFAINTALAKAAAADHAYRFEEGRKFRLDQWYWSRRTAGAGLVSDMASRVVSGLNGGVAGIQSGFASMAGAFSARMNALSEVGSAYGAMANFYGGIAQAGFGTAAYGMGRTNASGYGGVMGTNGMTVPQPQMGGMGGIGGTAAPPGPVGAVSSGTGSVNGTGHWGVNIDGTTSGW